MIKKIGFGLICGIVLLGLCGCGKKVETKTLQTNTRDENVGQIEVMTEYINIREKKDVSSNVLGKVYKGEIYTIISEDVESSYHWFEIETTNGIKGFISGKDDYVKVLEITNKNEDVEKPTEEETKEENASNNTSNNNTSNNNNKKPTNSTKPSTNNNTNNNSNNNSNNSNTNNNSNNNSSNNNGSSNNNNSNSGSTNNNSSNEKENEKKVINATITYKCPSGYKESYNKDDECWAYVDTGVKPTLTCPSGYELQGSKCKEVKEKLSAKANPICASGAEPIYETISGTYSCRDGSRVIPYRCPSGYTLGNIGNSYYCEYTNPQTKTPTATCSNGVNAVWWEGNQICGKVNKVSKKVYSCPSGYTLNGSKCYEN